MEKQERELQFGNGLLWPSLLWKKTVSIRKYRPEAHDFRRGERVIGVFAEDFGIVRVPLVIVRDTVKKSFIKITNTEAGASGFDSAAHAFMELKDGHYPDLEIDDIAAVIYYRPADVNVGARLLNWVRRCKNTCEIEGIALDECRDPDETREVKKELQRRKATKL